MVGTARCGVRSAQRASPAIYFVCNSKTVIE